MLSTAQAHNNEDVFSPRWSDDLNSASTTT